MLAKSEREWGKAFQRLTSYVDERGHCLVPLAYITEDGFSLGEWVHRCGVMVW